MLNSMHHQPTIADIPTSDSAQPIATGVIVHDSNRDRASWSCRLWQYLVHQLVRSHEPRIWRQYHSSAQPIWRVYDPQTGRSAYCHSEAEVVDWLEQLVHRC